MIFFSLILFLTSQILQCHPKTSLGICWIKDLAFVLFSCFLLLAQRFDVSLGRQGSSTASGNIPTNLRQHLPQLPFQVISSSLYTDSAITPSPNHSSNGGATACGQSTHCTPPWLRGPVNKTSTDIKYSFICLGLSVVWCHKNPFAHFIRYWANTPSDEWSPSPFFVEWEIRLCRASISSVTGILRARIPGSQLVLLQNSLWE